MRRLRRSARRDRIDHPVMGDHGVRHAALADEGGQRPGVDAVEPDDAPRLQPGVEPPRRTEIRGIGDVGANDHAARAGARRQIDRLDVFLIRADIADMGKSEGDDLAGVGGIGQDLLIAGHRRVEADFADRGAGRAEANPFEYDAVGHDQQRRRLRAAQPSFSRSP